MEIEKKATIIESDKKNFEREPITEKDEKTLDEIRELQERLVQTKADSDPKAIDYLKKRIKIEEDLLMDSVGGLADDGVEKINKINGVSEADVKEAEQAGQRLKSSVELAMEKTGGLINKKSVEKIEESVEKKPAEDGSLKEESGKDIAAEEKKEKRREMRESQKELDDARKGLASIDRSDSRYPEVEERYRLQIDAMKALMWRAKRDQLEKKEYLDEETGKYRKLNPEETKERLDKYASEIIAPHFAVMEAAKIQNLKAEQTFVEKVKDSRFAQFAYGAIDKYRKLPFKQKMLISGGLIATGLAAGAVGGAVGAGVAGAALLGKWTQRILSSGGTAMAAEAVIKRSQDKWMQKEGWGKNRHEFVSKEIDAIRNRVREEDMRETEMQEIGGLEMIKDRLNERKELENKLEKRRAGIALAAGAVVGSGAAFEGIKELSRFSGLSDFVSGKLTGAREYFGWTQEIAREKVGKIGHVELKIGSRGPEGAVANYFDKNPLVAKSYGWDGKADLHKWAGVKAHELWMDEAHEALTDPKILSQMDHLGYDKDLNGYAQMMRRIGKGIVEVDAASGKINLVDVDYLKNGTERLQQYNGPTFVDADKVALNEVLSGKGDKVLDGAVGDAKLNGMSAGDINAENLQKIMDNPDSKFGRIIANLYGSEQEGLKSAINRMGGLEKFMNSPASVLFYQEGQETSVFMEKFGFQLKTLTNDSYMLHDNVTPLRKILESIDSKKVYGGTAADFLGTGNEGGGVAAEKISGGIPAEKLRPSGGIPAEKLESSGVSAEKLGPSEVSAEKMAAPVEENISSAGGGVPAEKISGGEGLVAERIGGASIQNEAITTKTGVKGLFKYSPDGKVQNVAVNGGGSVLQGQSVFKDDWRTTMLNGGASNLQINAVVGRASTLFQYEELLKSLEQSGKGSSPEAEYLKKRIGDIIEPTEKQFGDIFK